MGNQFGNFASATEAENALIAEGFARRPNGTFTKRDRTGGNLFEAPRNVVAIVEITSYRVDGKWADDGRDYYVFQHHFL